MSRFVRYSSATLSACCLWIVQGLAADGKDMCRTFFAADSAFSQCARPGQFACTGSPYELVASRLKNCGITHTRERLIWGRMNPAPDVYDFSFYKTNALILKANGVVSTGLFGDAPGWTNGRKGCKLPQDLMAVYRFMRRAVPEFGDCYDAWEFWNEPDLSSTTEPVWEYAAALKAFALGVRDADPKKVVLPGSLSAVDHGGYGTILFRNDIAKYVDAYNLHTYNFLYDYPRWHKDIRKFLEEVGMPNGQVWLTECGTNIEGAGRKIGPNGCRAHDSDQEMVLAEFYPKCMILNRFGGIFRSWFFLFGCYNERGGTKDWGTMRRDGTEKPVMKVMSVMSRQLGSAELLGEVRMESSIRAFLFARADGQQVLAVWRRSAIEGKGMDEGRASRSPDTKSPVSFAVRGAEVKWTDAFGDMRRIKSRNGMVTLDVGHYASYLSGDLGMTADCPAADYGQLGAVPVRKDEDLRVVLKVVTDNRDFAISGRKSLAEMVGKNGRIRIEAWNFSNESKTVKLQSTGAVLESEQEALVVAPWQKAECLAMVTPPTGESFEDVFELVGTMGNRRTSAVRIPMVFRERFLEGCKETRLTSVDTPAGWIRNTSAETYSAKYDDDAQGVRFDVSWPTSSSVGRWFFPIHELKGGESLDGVKFVAFDVKTSQDKVENDVGEALLMLVRKNGSSLYLPYGHPTFGWETRYVRLPEGDWKAFRVGVTPQGHRLSFWIRNVRFLR